MVNGEWSANWLHRASGSFIIVNGKWIMVEQLEGKRDGQEGVDGGWGMVSG